MQGYLIFHLNLAFSSVCIEARPDVVEKCYWPLLRWVQRSEIPVGIELTGWTLEQIQQADPAWVAAFREFLQQGRCELIGSGWTQMIGPLAPYPVNRWNQRLGLEAYRRILGITPNIALVNEMAFSSGMVDVYAEAGYAGLVMDRDNVRLALNLVDSPISETPTHALGCEDEAMPVVWADSILFQRLQRAVHGDIAISDYLSYVQMRAARDQQVLPIYCNDAEVFDYRPGRFATESELHQQGEWRRLEQICQRLEDHGMQWLSPSEVLATVQQAQARPARLSSVSHPVPVKKQAKYNINRWAASGRDDLWLNSACYRLYQALQQNSVIEEQPWRELCELWASDLRTHLTDKRWQQAQQQLQRLEQQWACKPPLLSELPPINTALPGGLRVSEGDEGILLTIETPVLQLVVNTRRGLAIESLGFKTDNFAPLLGTLAQGYFASIELGADFYSGGVVMETPGNGGRATDLEWVQPSWHIQAEQVFIRAELPFANGRLEKWIEFNLTDEALALHYRFHQLARPQGSLRVANLTLIPEQWQQPLRLSCYQGGPKAETFIIDRLVQQGAPAATSVSSSASFSLTDGELILQDQQGRGLSIQVDMGVSATPLLLTHQPCAPGALTRLSFSLSELDDTARAGGHITPFSLRLQRLQTAS